MCSVKPVLVAGGSPLSYVHHGRHVNSAPRANLVHHPLIVSLSSGGKCHLVTHPKQQSDTPSWWRSCSETRRSGSCVFEQRIHEVQFGSVWFLCMFSFSASFQQNETRLQISAAGKPEDWSKCSPGLVLVLSSCASPDHHPTAEYEI